MAEEGPFEKLHAALDRGDPAFGAADHMVDHVPLDGPPFGDAAFVVDHDPEQWAEWEAWDEGPEDPGPGGSMDEAAEQG